MPKRFMIEPKKPPSASAIVGGFEETFTETEYGVIQALRLGLRCEQHWNAAAERDAWYYIEESIEKRERDAAKVI